MCLAGQVPARPASADQALAALEGALSYLAQADMTGLTAAEQAGCPRALERAESVHTAARTAALTAFTAGRGFEDDGQGSPRTWLKWQTRITGAAAAGAVGWMRRLAAHPADRDALGACLNRRAGGRRCHHVVWIAVASFPSDQSAVAAT